MKKIPIMFIGHGSPMNAIESNPFTEKLKQIRELYPMPEAIVCISAHWLTDGTWVTRMKNPRTIHDFYGFPQSLFDIQYKAPGSPKTADLIITNITSTKVEADEKNWGLDHGTWSVLRHIYPEANVPVVQLSIDISKPAQYHYNLGTQLKTLREHQVLIVGSGNIVHNLSKIKWESKAKPYDWAIEYDQWVKKQLIERNFKSLIDEYTTSQAGKLSVPTPEHYYPLLYILGASCENDSLKFEFEEIQNGSISMRTLSFK